MASDELVDPGAEDGLFPFLSRDFRSMRAPVRPVNVFELSGFPRWETVASRVLAYFLDPTDERHRLGSIGADSLLELLDGAPTVALADRPPVELDTKRFHGSPSWVVQTEAATEHGNRIDILMTNDEHDVAIVIENKLDATVNNPFESYAMRAAAAHLNVLSVVLAPTRRALSHDRSAWLSAAVTYDEFFDRLTAKLENVAEPDQRSVELLHQFIENTSEKEQRVSASTEVEMLDAFWSATTGRDNQIGEFFKALTRVNEILRRRADLLGAMISAELKYRRLYSRSWIVAGNDRTWGRADGRVAIIYVAFELITGNSIELLVGQFPGQEWSGFAVKAYPTRRGAGAMYSDFKYVPLQASWRDADADVVAEFLANVNELESRHPVQ